MWGIRVIPDQISSSCPPTFKLNACKFMWQLPEIRGIPGEFHTTDRLPPEENSRSPHHRSCERAGGDWEMQISLSQFSSAARSELSYAPSFLPSIHPRRNDGDDWLSAGTRVAAVTGSTRVALTMTARLTRQQLSHSKDYCCSAPVHQRFYWFLSFTPCNQIKNVWDWC